MDLLNSDPKLWAAAGFALIACIVLALIVLGIIALFKDNKNSKNVDEAEFRVAKRGFHVEHFKQGDRK